MYSLLISSAVALLVGVGGTYLEWWGWGWGIALGLVAFMITWIVIARKLMQRMRPAMDRMRKQTEGGHYDAAMATLEGMLPMGKWVPMLSGQLHAQIGAIAAMRNDKARAIQHLDQASRRAPDAQLVRACMHYRDGEKQKAIEILAKAAIFNKKHAMLHNTRAWILQKEGKTADAMAALAFYLKKESNQAAKDNLLRLQNDKKMSMKAFGNEWYALQLEKPPAGMQMQQARKGWRQPPKRRKS